MGPFFEGSKQLQASPLSTTFLFDVPCVGPFFEASKKLRAFPLSTTFLFGPGVQGLKGSKGPGVQGFKGPRLQGSKGFRVQGSKDSRVSRVSRVQGSGFKGSRSQGSRIQGSGLKKNSKRLTHIKFGARKAGVIIVWLGWGNGAKFTRCIKSCYVMQRARTNGILYLRLSWS